MKKNAFFFVLITLFVYLSSYSQNVTNPGGFFDTSSNVLVRDRSLNNSSSKADGTPYVNENFESVRLKRFANRIYSGRYNAYIGEMEIKTDGKIIALNNNEDFEVTFIQSKKTYKNYNFNDSRQFFVLVHSGSNFTLLKKENVRYKEAQEATTSYDKAKPAAFVKEKDTYYLKIGEEINEIPTRKKKFISYFKEHSKEIKSYMKKEKLDSSNDEDLIKLIEYIQQL